MNQLASDDSFFKEVGEALVICSGFRNGLFPFENRLMKLK